MAQDKEIEHEKRDAAEKAERDIRVDEFNIESVNVLDRGCW